MTMSSRRIPLLAAFFFLLIAFAALVPQLFWVTRDRDALVTQSLYEDAFYYFQTSRNVAEGHGSLSAGEIKHNGYHPLWMLTCSGFFAVLQEDLAAIRGIQIFGLVCVGLAGLCLMLALLEMGAGVAASLYASAVLMVNPWMLNLAVSGLEAPLNALLLALCTWWLVAFAGQTFSLWQSVLFGVALGLTYLVRTDNAFFVLGLAGILAWRVRQGRQPLRNMAVVLLASLVVVLPWHLWNLVHFGDFMQGSASALPVVRERAFFATHPGANAADFLAYRLRLLAGWFPAILYYSGLGSFATAFFAVWVIALVPRRLREVRLDLRCRVAHVLPLLFAMLCLGFVHKFVRLATREWYFILSDVLIAFLTGLGLDYFLRVVFRLAPAKKAVALQVALFAVVVLLSGAFLAKKTYSDWTARLARDRGYALEILDAVEALPPPYGPVGATDSGIIGFFASRPVINLDGVVNPGAAEAIKAGRLLDYAQSEGINYLTITPRMQDARILGPDWQERLKPFPALTAEGFQFRNKK